MYSIEYKLIITRGTALNATNPRSVNEVYTCGPNNRHIGLQIQCGKDFLMVDTQES